jgi:hypothetical protein
MTYALAVYSGIAVPSGLFLIVLGVGLVLATKDLSFLAAGAGLVYSGSVAGQWFMNRIKKEKRDATEQ